MTYASYSGYKLYRTCNFQYWNGYMNHTTLKEPEDKLGSIYGSVVGKLFDDFYREQLWRRDCSTELMDRVELTVDETLRKETTATKWRAAGTIKWKGEGPGQNPKGMYENREAIIDDVKATLERGVKIIKRHKLLGVGVKTELQMKHNTENGHILDGRCDFLIPLIAPERKLAIVDGKGSKHRDKYVDPKQLHWYAMMHRLVYGILPDKLAFLYWRSEPESALDWIDWNVSDIDDIYEDALQMVQEIPVKDALLTKSLNKSIRIEAARGIFKPNPNKENCKFCPYATDDVCPDGVRHKSK